MIIHVLLTAGAFLFGYLVSSLVEKYYNKQTVTELDFTQEPFISYREADNTTEPTSMRLTLPYDSHPELDPHRALLFGTPIVVDMHFADETIRQTVFITDIQEDPYARTWIIYTADAYNYVTQC